MMVRTELLTIISKIYDTHVSSLDWESCLYSLVDLLQEYNISEVWMELGRYATAECGVYAAKVVERKNVYGKELLILDGGTNHLSRPALVKQYFPCLHVSSLKQVHHSSNSPSNIYAIHGPLCTALDFLGEHELPSHVMPGDTLLFFMTGAYGFTESMPYFLGHPIAGVS